MKIMNKNKYTIKHINFILRQSKYPKGEPFIFDYLSRGKDGRLKNKLIHNDKKTI